MIYIAFDAATKTGWAFRIYGEWTTGVVDPRNWDAVEKLLLGAMQRGVDHVVIEDCYLGVNPHTHKVLAVVQGLITGACLNVGLPYEIIPAATWHDNFRITGDRVECKRGAMKVATVYLGAPAGISQDEADAVCLCDYMDRVHAATERGIR